MWIHFLIYAALGWCAEIIWTAVTRKISGKARDWRLLGETSLWVFPLYGSIPFWFEPLHETLRSQFVVSRALVYLLCAWAAEYMGGWLIWKVSGTKPWDYATARGGSLNGLIRWNFIFVWPWVGLGLEFVHDCLGRL
jgi:hypothetical protein